MNKIIKTIQTQVESCKKLLKVFQDERQVYNTKKSVGVKEVKTILARKKLIVSAFEAQHSVLKELKKGECAATKDDELIQKEALRELGSILEQLLVIDHENEKLLRKLLSVQPSRATNTRSFDSTGSARPALQRQLPFFPGRTQNVGATARPQNTSTGVAPSTASKLRQYGNVAATRTRLESKYA